MEKIRSLAMNEKWMEAIFIIMLLSFPFGSTFLSFSIGFMTVYPYFVLLGILTLLGFFRPFTAFSKPEKWYLFFLCFFLFYALAYLPFTGGRSHAIVDIRSIALMLMTSFVFIWIRHLLGYDKWKSVILFCFKVIFFLVLVFAIFEIVFGIHFAGFTTSQIEARGINDSFVYTPVFLWDNPNNLVVYFYLLGAAIILLEPDSPWKNARNWLIILICFFISYIALARIGIFLAGTMAIFIGIGNIRENSKNPVKGNSRWPYVVYAVAVMLLVFVTKDKFTGIPPEKVRSCKEIVLAEQYLGGLQRQSLIGHEVIYTGESATLEQSSKKPEVQSGSERMALFMNGVDFTVSSKLLGIGPGQFTYRHDVGQIKHYAFGNNGAHAWLLELISQYGILIFAPYMLILFWIFWVAVKARKTHPGLASNLVLALVCLGVTSNLPSAFLILDINWIFTVILVIVFAHLYQQRQTAK